MYIFVIHIATYADQSETVQKYAFLHLDNDFPAVNRGGVHHLGSGREDLTFNTEPAWWQIKLHLQKADKGEYFGLFDL